MTDAMADAIRRQINQAQASMSVNRDRWTRKQWIEDADRLMNESDGAVTSLVNGHVMHLLAEVQRLRKYGRHLFLCDFNVKRRSGICDCGWAEVEAGL